MAKKGVIMYYDLLEQLQDFTDEQFGKITRAMIKYDRDGIEPQFNDIQIRLAFNILKPTIDRNKQEYQEKCDKNRENINKRWKKQDTNEYDCIRMNTNYTDIDIDKDKDKEIDINIEKDINKKEIYKEKVEQSPTHTQSFKEEKHKYGEYGWIKLTDNQYNKLCEDYSRDYIDFAIKKIDEYVQSNGNKNKYKDWNLVLRKAIREKWHCLNGYEIKAEEKTQEDIEKEYEEWNKKYQDEIDELGF